MSIQILTCKSPLLASLTFEECTKLPSLFLLFSYGGSLLHPLGAFSYLNLVIALVVYRLPAEIRLKSAYQT